MNAKIKLKVEGPERPSESLVAGLQSSVFLDQVAAVIPNLSLYIIGSPILLATAYIMYDVYFAIL